MTDGFAGIPRGKLKIYLGYAAGVGKTYTMLKEARELKMQGHDVVIGYFEPHGRPDTMALTEGLEMIPRRQIAYRGATFEEMDTDAVLKRNPEFCAVDEFAHTNVPGSERNKRWEDVQVLLDAGINVLTTMNVQHIESLNDQVWSVSGVRVRETVPDWVVMRATEVVDVDLPPEALFNRLRRGAIYSPEKAQQAMLNFFRESTLRVLRDLALRQTAHEVEIRQSVQEEAETIEKTRGALSGASEPEATSDRILIYVTANPSSAMLIRRGRRVADYLRAGCFAVSIYDGSDVRRVSPAAREALEKHLNFARNLHIETRLLHGDNVPRTLVEFARRHYVTQIYLARPPKRFSLPTFGRGLVQQVVHLARDMQVTVVAERRRQAELQ
ncbi:MAG: histidine kinase [Terriglobia bacterium]